MTKNQEHIRDLILFEFAGQIQEHQLAYLNFLLEACPEVVLLRKRIIEKFSDPRLQAALKKLEKFSIAFLKIVRRKRRIYVNRRWRLKRPGGKLKKIVFKHNNKTSRL